MTILRLPIDIGLASRNPYYILGRDEAVREILAAFVEAYGEVFGRFDTTHKGGLVRWAIASENLGRATAKFGAYTKEVGGQWRLVWPGLGGEATELIVLRGVPREDGFDTSERGIRSEEHAMLEGMSFRNEDGTAMTTGSYLFHSDAVDEEGHCDVWFVASGRTQKGWEHVLCESAYHLGRARYSGGRGGGVKPVDIRP